jgi:signal transduction histidine kinase
MNNLVVLGTLYGLMTFGAAAILYGSFRGQVDVSGRFFLVTELLMIPVIGLVILTNLLPSTATPLIFFATNFLLLGSDFSAAFSIYSLTKKPKVNSYFWSLVAAALICGFAEIARIHISPKAPLAIIGVITAALAFFTYAISRDQIELGLDENKFLKWFGILEIGVGIFALVRASSTLTDNPISPRNPSNFVTISYAILMTMNIFRYISYQSLRISWVDPRMDTWNSLNKSLAKVIEEKDQLLRSLMASNRVLGISALASSLAHQLSQPLTAIALHSEAAKLKTMQLIKDKDTADSFEKISNQITKISDLITTLRQLFSPQNTQFTKIDLQKTTLEMLELLNPTFNDNKIQLHNHFLTNPQVYGDSIQLQQAIINILNNAVDELVQSNPITKNITISVMENHEFAIITIADTGSGISKKINESLFELSTTTKKDGLGIGLWLSKIIIEKHKGKISASNISTGGAQFEIYIPLAQ